MSRAAKLLLGALSLIFGVVLSDPASAVATGPEESALNEGLSLTVTESGPTRPWQITLTNETEKVVNVVRDPRLLSLVVKLPGKRKPAECKLPSAMLPNKAETERLVRLRPKKSFSFRIDPRFYCFDGGDRGTLVPGALVEARYGFEPKTKTTFRGGRRVEERLPSTPPYVAQFLRRLGDDELTNAEDSEDEADMEEAAVEDGEADDSDEEAADEDANDEGDKETDLDEDALQDGNNNADDENGEDADEGMTSETEQVSDPSKEQKTTASAYRKRGEERKRHRFRRIPHDPDAPGLRQLGPFRMALGSEYTSWSAVDPAAEDPTEGLRIEVVQGSDSLTARGAQVTVRVSNRGHRKQQLFLRRELISYYLLGPDGLMVCSADDDERAPSTQGFTTLNPGEQTTLVTRLIEFCPNDLIDRAGFYLVGAELEAEPYDGEFEVEPFVGTLFTTRGKPVRIQKGELPFVHHDLPRSGVRFARGGGLRRKRANPGSRRGDSGGAQGGAVDAPAAPPPMPPPPPEPPPAVE